MKKIIGFFTVLFLVSCSKNFDKTYKGKIGNKYDIIITLFADGGEVQGEYFYEAKGQALRLNGNVDNEGNIILQETLDGKRTGVINAKKVGDEINGVWKNPNNGKELDFSVKEVDINYNDVYFEKSIKAAKKQEEIEYKKLTGTFSDKHNKRRKAKIEYLGNNQLLFEIDVASANCAREPYKGVAKILNLNKSVFKKGNFELTLLFQGRNVDVNYKGSDDDLGLFCYPSGIFTR